MRDDARVSGVGVNPKQAVDEGGLRGAFLCQKVGNLEFVYAAVPGGLPFVTNQETAVDAIEDQRPPVFIQTYETGAADATARSKAASFKLKHDRCAALLDRVAVNWQNARYLPTREKP